MTVGADRRSLAAALLAFAERPAGVVGIAPERIDHLLGERPSGELPFSLLMGALVTLAALTAEIIGDLLTTGTTDVDIEALSPTRAFTPLTEQDILKPDV